MCDPSSAVITAVFLTIVIWTSILAMTAAWLKKTFTKVGRATRAYNRDLDSRTINFIKLGVPPNAARERAKQEKINEAHEALNAVP